MGSTPPGAMRKNAKVLSQRFEAAEQILLARDTDDLIAQLAVLEKKQRRNRANIVLERETLVVVHVYLCNLDLTHFFARDLVQQRRNHFTRTAPFRPKIDDHRFVVLRQFAVKIRFVKCDSCRIFHN